MASSKAPGASDYVLDFEGFPGRWEILETTAETDGERLTTRMHLDERSELPVHVHPHAEEVYEVETGEIEVRVDGEWSTLAAGDRMVVPAGTEHAFRNPGPATVRNVHRPAMRIEAFFRRFHALKTERGVSMPPEGLRSTILLAMLFAEYDDELVVAGPQRWVFGALAALGRVLGYDLPD
ncbi:cupin domain-containing protein [Halorubellus litoreus]|uniref:Cupin domain-containing protein n=1 Tax=Halorubellus litoreus TaxID=755308 RepID=A0ABD5VEI2_9EURY